MIVEIDQDLFASDDLDPGLLLGVFRQGARGRFTVRARPAWSPTRSGALADWLARQDAWARDEANKVLREGLTRPTYALGGRAEPRIWIRPRASPAWPESFDDGPVVLPPGEELERLLDTRLELWLENGRNDLAFLKKAAPAGWGARLQRALDSGWIESRNGGGIDELRQIVGLQLAENERRRLRSWVLFDSDARRPGHPSHQADLTAQVCSDWRIPFHMLQRRAIENYLPLPTLFDWASRQRQPAEAHAQVRAVQGLSVDQRAHIHVREGLSKDFGDRVLGEPFDVPPVQDRALIQRGLGTSVTAIWSSDDYSVSLGDLTSDGSDAERHALFQSLFASL